MKDEIIDEIRAYRLKTEKECLDKGITFEDHILEVQKLFTKRLVNFEKNNLKSKSLTADLA